jgi:hypothetical protein
MPFFSRYIGIDYSGAETPNASLKGLRVYVAESDIPPVEVPPPPSPRKYWTRRGIAEWLTERLAEDIPTLVGIDHGFSFPLRYFEVQFVSCSRMWQKTMMSSVGSSCSLCLRAHYGWRRTRLSSGADEPIPVVSAPWARNARMSLYWD